MKAFFVSVTIVCAIIVFGMLGSWADKYDKEKCKSKGGLGWNNRTGCIYKL